MAPYITNRKREVKKRNPNAKLNAQATIFFSFLFFSSFRCFHCHLRRLHSRLFCCFAFSSVQIDWASLVCSNLGKTKRRTKRNKKMYSSAHRTSFIHFKNFHNRGLSHFAFWLWHNREDYSLLFFSFFFSRFTYTFTMGPREQCVEDRLRNMFLVCFFLFHFLRSYLFILFLRLLHFIAAFDK